MNYEKDVNLDKNLNTESSERKSFLSGLRANVNDIDKAFNAYNELVVKNSNSDNTTANSGDVASSMQKDAFVEELER